MKTPDAGDRETPDTTTPHQPTNADFQAFAHFRSRVQSLSDLELLTALGKVLDTKVPPFSMAFELLIEFEARLRLDELRRAAPRLSSTRLNDAALTISEKAQEIVAALAAHQLTAAEANTALYALQIAASALRQMQPAGKPGRPKNPPPPPPSSEGARGTHTRGTTPTDHPKKRSK